VLIAAFSCLREEKLTMVATDAAGWRWSTLEVEFARDEIDIHSPHEVRDRASRASATATPK